MATDFSQLRAVRIAEAQTRVTAAENTLATARTALATAEDTLATTSTDENKAAVVRAKQAVDDATRVLAYETTLFQNLLGVDHRDWMPLLQYGIFGLLALIILIFLMYGIVNDKFLPSLASIPTSRGLITFLITVVTATIALVLTLATVISDSPDRIQRFLAGKDLLFALIGVLGTIVGFYFGQSNDSENALTIAPAFLSADTLNDGNSVTLATFVSGGKQPYTYSIEFQPPEFPPVKDQTSADGHIVLNVVGKPVEQDTAVNFTIQVKDSEGKEVTYKSSDEKKSITLKAAPAATE